MNPKISQSSSVLDADADPPELRFTWEDSESASEAWNASCGPHSIAAACGKTLDEVHAALGERFSGWMNPTMIRAALYDLGIPYRLTTGLRTKELCHGINRIQFEGPWLNPGVPKAAAYKHTHYVARIGRGVLCTMIVADWMPIECFWDWHAEYGKPMHITHHFALHESK